MADVRQLELIHWVPDWNRWRAENPKVIPDLRVAELQGVKLREANLSRADLSGVNLHRANLRGADLSGADLSLADLREADLSETNLSGTKLRVTDFVNANFNGANLTGANFSGAYFGETVFGNSNLKRTRGLETCIHRGPSILDHRTLVKSGQLPPKFLRGCGLPDTLIEYLPSLLNQPLQFYSCFISYNHVDKAFARLLHDTLQGRGIRCWLDEKQLLPGDNIYDHVDRGIRFWDKLLLCCSEASLTSWWVDTEIGKAFDKEQALMKDRKEKVQVLIPLSLDAYLLCGEWKNGKASQVLERLAGDFTGWKRNHTKFEKQVEAVIRALRADEHAREKPPKSLL